MKYVFLVLSSYILVFSFFKTSKKTNKKVNPLACSDICITAEPLQLAAKSSVNNKHPYKYRSYLTSPALWIMFTEIMAKYWVGCIIQQEHAQSRVIGDILGKM